MHHHPAASLCRCSDNQYSLSYLVASLKKSAALPVASAAAGDAQEAEAALVRVPAPVQVSTVAGDWSDDENEQ